MIKYLTIIALSCILVSTGALYQLGVDGKEILNITFAPVGIIVAGLIGYMNREGK